MLHNICVVSNMNEFLMSMTLSNIAICEGEIKSELRFSFHFPRKNYAQFFSEKLRKSLNVEH